jgi:hypothetical protein
LVSTQARRLHLAASDQRWTTTPEILLVFP